MLKRIRRGYHVLVAEWLIEHSGRRASEHAGLIAEHLVLARRSERALSYMRLAGEQAASRYAHGEAVDYFSRALDLLDQLSQEPGQVQQERYALLQGREAVFRLLGERDAQAADLADLKILAEEMDEMGKRAEVALLHAAYYRAVSDFDTALATAQDAVRWAERASDPHLTCQGFVSWGLTLWQQGRFEDSRTHLEEALALAQRHENQSCEASTLHNLGTVQYFLGDFEGARDYCRQAQAIRRALGDRRGEALSLNNLVAIYDGLGDLAEGKVCGAEALAIYQLIGDRPSEAHALDNLGQNSHALGDLETACEHYQQALAVRRAVGDRGGEAGTLENLGLALHDLGYHEQARQHCEQALAIEREVGDRRGEGYSLTYLALALEGLGDLQAAAATYQEALHLRREIGQEALAIDDVAGLAGLALKRGQIAGAQALAEEALVWIEEHGVQGIDYPVRVYLTCASVLTATGQADRASGILAAARALVEERAARISDEDTRRSFREKVPLHARLWQMDSQQTPAFPPL
jgi:tetratricopeptide (TPR) repeat protein